MAALGELGRGGWGAISREEQVELGCGSLFLAGGGGERARCGRDRAARGDLVRPSAACGRYSDEQERRITKKNLEVLVSPPIGHFTF